jgi:class 3 adenylate cyclase
MQTESRIVNTNSLTCGCPYTNPQAFYDGPTDLHEEAFDGSERQISFYSYSDESINRVPKHWAYSFSIYATSKFEQQYKTSLPMFASISVASTCGSIILAILLHDWFLHKRDRKVKVVAVASSGIVRSFFPGKIRDHIIDEYGYSTHMDDRPGHNNDRSGFAQGLTSRPRPIASLFVDTTVLYADIVGFTQWSAVREPEQVFELLETVFRAFDRIARRRGVYKVETIGDCYVAVTGLPDPQPDHAEIMVLFAVECLRKMKCLVEKLRVRLGDGTNELSLRIGLNSGQVTAGVLRGSKARFQLFGETVNKAAQIESSGRMSKIHVSRDTAHFLKTAGKGLWLVPRSEAIQVGRISETETYWISEAQVLASRNS